MRRKRMALRKKSRIWEEKPQENEGSKDSSIHPDAKSTDMQPRENIFVAGGATSEGETAADALILPSAKKRSQFIPPQAWVKSRTRVPSKAALRRRSRLTSTSPPRQSSRTRGRSGNRPTLLFLTKGLLQREAQGLWVTTGLSTKLRQLQASPRQGSCGRSQKQRSRAGHWSIATWSQSTMTTLGGH